MPWLCISRAWKKTIRWESLKPTFKPPSLDLQAVKSLIVDLNNFLLRNWVRLGQGVARHWQRWDKAYSQEITAFESTSPDHQQSPHDKDSCQAPGCWTKPLGWGQPGAEQVDPFLVFQKAVGISNAFQATVKKSHFANPIALLSSPIIPKGFSGQLSQSRYFSVW